MTSLCAHPFRCMHISCTARAQSKQERVVTTPYLGLTLRLKVCPSREAQDDTRHRLGGIDEMVARLPLSINHLQAMSVCVSHAFVFMRFQTSIAPFLLT